MAKRWADVGEKRRNELVEELRSRAENAASTADREALLAASERLIVRAATGSSKRSKESYQESSLWRRLALDTTHDAAIEDIARAVDEAAGIEGAYQKLGVSRRNLFRILERWPKAREAVDRVLIALRSPQM